ncbi:MAG: AAA family ATPase [Actinomycetota bacterium]|nr:AAA family ATPase [Actinomycetota bacterium]
MKLGIVGKGGVGKTTLSALLAQGYVGRGERVVAIDTDSNPNLGISLGLTFNEAEAVPVIPRALVMGSGAGMTPEELMREYSRQTPVGVRLLSAMRVSQAGAG